MATFIEDPLGIQKTIDIPQDHLDACKGENIPTTGNAAGNTVNLLDLTNEPAPPAPLPAG
jgi:iron transport multicopper oxidase